MSDPSTSKVPSCVSAYFQPVLDIVQAGEPGVTVVVPPNGSGDEEGERIVQAIRARYGIDLSVVTGDRATQALSTPHVIALGCLANNPFIEGLYLRWHTLVDRWYPGSGGYVIQMIPSPYRQNHHVLILGGSDPQGVHTATDRFLEQLDSNNTGRISWQLEVRLGPDHLPLPEDRMDVLGTATSPISTSENVLPDKSYEPAFRSGAARDHLLRLGMFGPHADNFHLSRSSQLGLRYLYTGCTEDAHLYHQTLLEEANTGVIEKLYHYKSLRMFQLWGLLAPCPIFDDDDRRIINRAIKTYLLEESGIANTDVLREVTKRTEIFNRHQACDALNLWAGADWLWRQTGEARWLTDRSVADAYFEAQTGTDVPLTGLTEGYTSYLEVYLEWMLLSCPHRIVQDPHIHLWAERVIGLCTNTGQLVIGPQTDASRYPYHLMRKLAYLLNDGRYLFVANLREQQVHHGMDRVMQFSAGQAYAGDMEPQKPDDILGLRIYTLNERLRQWKASSINPGEGFDRMVARSGWDPADDYLMVIGVRSGAKSLPNVGTLAAYERFGQRLITSDAVSLYPHSASPWRQSTVTVSAGGLGAGMAEGARMLVNRQTAGGYLFSYQTDLPGFYRWTRLLYWKPAAYVFVIDRLVVERDEAYTLGVNWRCAEQVAVQDDRAVMAIEEVDGQFYIQASNTLHLSVETNTYPMPGAPPGDPPIVEHMLHTTVDAHPRTGEVEVATLLHAVTGTDRPSYQMNGHGTSWFVDGPDETRCFTTGKGAGDIEIEVFPLAESGNNLFAESTGVYKKGPNEAKVTLPWRWACRLPGEISVWTHTADGSGVAIATEQGHVMVLNAEGHVVWSAQCDGAVTALTFFEETIFAGTRSGVVYRFDESGQVQWRYTCRFRPERPFWPWWFLETPAIGAVAAGYDRMRGQPVVVVGTGSSNLNFLDANTGSLLKDVLSPYGFPDLIRTYEPDRTGGLHFLVGHTWLTCGSTVRLWCHPYDQASGKYYESVDSLGRTMDEWDTCGVSDFWAGPLVHGESDCIIVLRHGAVNQITAYEAATGIPLWDIGLGGAPIALAVVPGESSETARCYVAEQFGWLAGFDGSGKQVIGSRLARSLHGMHAATAEDLVLWNEDEWLIHQAGLVTDWCRLEGKPLGWVSHPEAMGLLCVEEGRLVMRQISMHES